MKHYAPSSELHRAAEEAERNASRLAAYRMKVAAHGNGNVVRFPRWHKQYGRTTPPGAPAAT